MKELLRFMCFYLRHLIYMNVSMKLESCCVRLSLLRHVGAILDVNVGLLCELDCLVCVL